MTSTHETWRDRTALARATPSIMTMSDGRDAAQAVWTAVFDTAVAPVPAANRRADRWANSFEMAFDRSLLAWGTKRRQPRRQVAGIAIPDLAASTARATQRRGGSALEACFVWPVPMVAGPAPEI